MTRDGKRVGTVDQLVLDSETREVRAIIVHRGFLFTEDRIVDRAWGEAVAPDGTVWLSLSADEVEELPQFVEAEFVRLTQEEATSLPYVWPTGGGWGQYRRSGVRQLVDRCSPSHAWCPSIRVVGLYRVQWLLRLNRLKW